ncbi:mitochondrial large ribosomal subunit l49 [Colletotrichum kahawae]|uniref:Large ribosomal subunit protein mL49 n=1 Tax=Colletotrichum kahawae TaxID=34407 RepID=A0AAE0DDY1_COLKA|nr:mitochondrial large ribosomal subunit l49 [Colletotrichum camelliae]KAK2773837.1 mitochondrial large ribosomal subunit l49 [Colletotrichum kahawae]
MNCTAIRTAFARPATVLPRSAILPTVRFSSTATPASKPYLVNLTASNSYPVYRDDKAAGSSKRTVIKKIEGNRKALITDVSAAIKVPKENFRINPVTQHVEIKGHHTTEIKEFLATTFGNPKIPKTTPTEVKA